MNRKETVSLPTSVEDLLDNTLSLRHQTLIYLKKRQDESRVTCLDFTKICIHGTCHCPNVIMNRIQN